MAGNSQRRGATRGKSGKKGATVGSGGQRRKALSGRGPTPKAEERTGHPAARRAKAAQRRSGKTNRDGQRGPRGMRGSSEVVAGRNAVVEALRAGVPASTLYVASRIEGDDRVRESLKLANEAGLALLETPRGELDRLTGGALHQGLALQVPPYDYLHPDDLVARAEESGEPALLVALDGVTDPRNLGAVIRSVAAFGGHGVLVPERRAAGVTAAAWKTSAGTAARVPVARATNLSRALRSYAESGLFVVGLAADADTDVAELDVAVDPLVLVAGSEGAGLSRLVREACDLVVRVPMAAHTESLNAGVATGVALYEIARQRAARRG